MKSTKYCPKKFTPISQPTQPPERAHVRTPKCKHSDARTHPCTHTHKKYLYAKTNLGGIPHESIKSSELVLLYLVSCFRSILKLTSELMYLVAVTMSGRCVGVMWVIQGTDNVCHWANVLSSIAFQGLLKLRSLHSI